MVECANINAKFMPNLSERIVVTRGSKRQIGAELAGFDYSHYNAMPVLKDSFFIRQAKIGIGGS